jgi:hypothetical protein
MEGFHTTAIYSLFPCQRTGAPLQLISHQIDETLAYAVGSKTRRNAERC